MVELLAATDPFAAVLGCLWLFAAGMFPAAIMLGSQCSPCCNPCGLCSEGSLPETLTVTFSGLADKTQGPDLISVSFSSCYGSGAEAKVTAPGGDPAIDAGPISAVSLTSGGSWYAKLGRIPPTVTITGSGAGATFTPTLTKSQDACGIDHWAVSSVSVTGGTGYVDGETLSVSVANGDTEEQAATVVIHTKRDEPALSLDGDATVSLTYTDNLDGTWSIASVSVTDGGTSYGDGDPIGVVLGSDNVEVSPAILTARTGRLEPTIELFFPLSSGTGASLSPTLTQTTDGNGRDVWAVTAVTVDTAGSGYSVGDLVYATVTDGVSAGVDLVAEVASVDGNGGVLSVTVIQQGLYFKSDGILQSVEIVTGGFYYKDTGEPDTVEVTAGGIYYREDASEPPYVATVTVIVTDTAPSGGSGALLTATVDSNTSSGTFGRITGLTITNGGSGYLAWQWRNTKCCGDYYNGMSVVVKRNNHAIGSFTPNEPCRFIHRMCGVGNLDAELGYVMVEYLGPSTPPVVYIVSEHNIARDGSSSSDASPSLICNTTFTTENLVTDCGTWLDDADEPIVFTATGGATATVASGGEYDSDFKDAGGLSCHICCKGAAAVPSEIEATFTDPRTTKPVDLSGTYVLPLTDATPALVWSAFAIPDPNTPTQAVSISVSVDPCAAQSTTAFSPDINYGCDECHKECRVTAGLSLGPFGSLGACLYTSLSVDPCGQCEATPVCDPTGRSFTGDGGGGCNMVTITT